MVPAGWLRVLLTKVAAKNERGFTMPQVSMKMLLESGVHFGHQTNRWNPKMKPYIFGARNGIYIVDLQQTVHLFDVAYRFIVDTVTGGKDVMYVGTKRQAQESVKTEAERCGMPYVNQRWLGGMLTNFATIKKSIDRLKKIDGMFEDESINSFPKKEIMKLQKERDKLQKVLGGIRDMERLPGAIFVIDPKREHIAIREGRRLGIPIVAIADTNCDPDDIDYIIPGNDDAIRAIKLFSLKIADAVEEGKRRLEEKIQAESDKEEAEPEAESDVPESVESKGTDEAVEGAGGTDSAATEETTEEVTVN